MIIISHKDGFSVSRDAHIDMHSDPIMEDGRIKSVRRYKVAIVNNPYTVRGELKGDVNFAIEDENTGDIKCYKGTINNNVITIKNETNNNWLWQIK